MDPKTLETWLRRGGHDLRGNLATIEFALQGLKRFTPEGSGLPQNEVLEILRRRTGTLKGDLEQFFMFLRLALLPPPVPADAADTTINQLLVNCFAEIPDAQKTRLPSGVGCECRGRVPGLMGLWALLPVIRNAVQYGTGVIGMACTEIGGSVTIDVSNRGTGIPVHEQVLIFEPYMRGTHNRPQPGMGLGLAVARLAVARMGGTLELISATAFDTRFRLTIPLTLSES